VSARGDQRLALLQYLNALFGAEPIGAFAELRIAGPRPLGGMAQRFFDVRDTAAIAAEVVRAGPRSDVYIGVAPRSRREGTRAAVERVHCLWVDVDDDRERLRAFRPLPAIVVESGTGLHAYWPLIDPIGPDEVEVANRQLAQAVDGDPRSTDAARILRPPGTFNHKGDQRRPVTIVRCKAEVFALEDVVGKLPPLATSAPTGRDADRRGERREVDPTDALGSIAPPVYLGLLCGVDVPDRGGMVRCPLPDHEDRTPSCYVYADAAAGWYCYGCGRGGSLIDLGAALWGVDPRGRGYHDLRRRLAAELTGRAAA
jgi:hypothetical protein